MSELLSRIICPSDLGCHLPASFVCVLGGWAQYTIDCCQDQTATPPTHTHLALAPTCHSLFLFIWKRTAWEWAEGCGGLQGVISEWGDFTAEFWVPITQVLAVFYDLTWWTDIQNFLWLGSPFGSGDLNSRHVSEVVGATCGHCLTHCLFADDCHIVPDEPHQSWLRPRAGWHFRLV